MAFFQTNLKDILLSPGWQLAVLAIVGTAALQVLVAVWAAASQRHWFLRAMVVWGAIAVLVRIRAYEPALLFAISSPLTVAAICGWHAITSRRAAGVTPTDNTPASTVRFGLRDLFFLLAIVGLSLAVLIEVVRNLGPIAWSSLAAYVLALVGLGASAYAVVCGKRYRAWTYVGAMGAIVASIFLVWSSNDWLRLAGLFGIYPYLPFMGETIRFAVALTCEVALIYCLLLLLFRLATAEESSLRRRLTRLCLAAAGMVCLLCWMPIYWHVLWLTPVPPSVTDHPNHYDRIMAIATEVAASKQDEQSLADLRAAKPHSDVPHRLEKLYDELLPLLDGPNAVVPPPPVRDRDGTAGYSRNIDSIQAVRSLGRGLSAEAKQAASSDDLDRAVAWDLANMRLGCMFSRGGTTIDYLVGMAVEGTGTQHLAELRGKLSPDQSREVIAALERALSEHEMPEIVRNRDTAYWERWEGWPARLEIVLAYMQGSTWGTDATSAHSRRVTLHRLLQADLAVRAYRQNEGSWPKSLEELVPTYLPSAPLDPHSGQSLRYRPTGDEFVLYSVGQDEIDDGGHFGSPFQYHNEAGFDLDLDSGIRP